MKLTRYYVNQDEPRIAGSNLASGVYRVEGHEFKTGAHTWTVVGVFMPLTDRKLRGLRALVRDQRNVVGFINQRDLEVCLGQSPGGWCEGAHVSYVSPTNDDWYGVTMDFDDRRDDLWLREWNLRLEAFHKTGSLAMGQAEITRSLYQDNMSVIRERLHFIGSHTGDMTVEGVVSRWRRIDSTSMLWTDIPFSLRADSAPYAARNLGSTSSLTAGACAASCGTKSSHNWNCARF